MTNANETAELKATEIGLRGAWIEVMDAETRETLFCMNLPERPKTGAFAARVVKKAASLGYRVETMIGMGGWPVVKIC